MLFKPHNVELQERDSDEIASAESKQATGFWITVASLSSHLEQGAKSQTSLEIAMEHWYQWQAENLSRQYNHVLKASLAWWLFFRNPVRCFIFHTRRRKVLQKPGFGSSTELDELEVLLGRAEFMYPLSSDTRKRLRQKIEKGEISRWRAFSLLRSSGCRITDEGLLLPSPVGRGWLAAGTVSSVIFGVAILFFITGLANELGAPCRPCVLLFGSQVLLLATFLLIASLSLSWGKEKNARLLDALRVDLS